MATAPNIADLRAEVGQAIALERNGRPVEADAIYRSLHGRFANHPTALNALGVLCGQAGALDHALGFLSRAAAMAPRDASILANFGSALTKVFNFELAIDHLERAVGINPEFQPAWHSLASAYNAAGQSESALELATKLKAKDPNHIGARLNIVQAQMHLGKFDPAEAEALEIIERWPDNTRGYALIAPLRRFKDGDPVIGQAEALLQSGRCAPHEIGDLNFALGKMYDDCGRVQDAFRAFSTANTRNAMRYNRKDNEERFRTIAQGYSVEFLARQKGKGFRSDVPILIVGMPRSGTTLVESALLAHRDVASVGEAHFLRATAMSIDGFAPREGDFAGVVRSLSSDALEFLGHRYVEQLLDKVEDRSKTRIVDKMPHNFTNLGFAALTLPDVKVLHVRRSPMATCLSCWMQNFNQSHEYAAQFDDLAHHYSQYRKLMAHWKSAIGDRILDVVYENLVRNPEAETRRILEWLGLSTEGYSVDSRASKVVTTASAWQVRQPIYQNAVDHWRGYEQFLTPLKLALLDRGIDPEAP